MIKKPSQDDMNERKEIWKWIRWWKDKLGLNSAELAHRVGYSQDLIERGLSGEPVPIRHALCNFVEAFGLTNKRAKFFEETIDTLTDNDCKKLLKPLSETPFRQGNLWDHED